MHIAQQCIAIALQPINTCRVQCEGPATTQPRTRCWTSSTGSPWDQANKISKKVSAKKLRSSYNIWARAIKELSNEHLLYKLIYLWRLDVEKEVDSLDILGDLDFKVEHPLLAMFQVGKYVFGNVSSWQISFWQYLSLFQEFVAIMKEVAESSASPEVGYKDRKIANKLCLIVLDKPP